MALLLLFSFAAAPAFAENFGGGSQAWNEATIAFPPAPSDASLKAFFVSAESPNRFMIDHASLSVDSDGVVRYVLVVRTPGGAENVTYEGIRCATAAWRIYASGRKEGAWAPLKRSQWVSISYNTYNRPRAALASEVFCDGPVPARSREEILRRLDGRFDPADFRQKDR